MATREQLRELDPAVVDAAIERIVNGLNQMSCIALLRAQDHHGYISFAVGYDNEYVKAYRENTCLLGMKPVWWDNTGYDYCAARIQALEDFRDAIIAAKKQTIRERVSAWLASPCEIPN